VRTNRKEFEDEEKKSVYFPSFKEQQKHIVVMEHK
jgi:hypothetical protein